MAEEASTRGEGGTGEEVSLELSCVPEEEEESSPAATATGGGREAARGDVCRAEQRGCELGLDRIRILAHLNLQWNWAVGSFMWNKFTS